MNTLFKRFRKDRKGATAIEYGLIAGAMAVVIAGVFAAFGEDLVTQFETITGNMGAPAIVDNNDGTFTSNGGS